MNVVSGTVIDDDDFGERNRLFRYGCEQAIEQIRAVVDGNYGRDLHLYTEIVMKQFALAAFCGAALLAQNPAVRSVYILPMTGGLDQYLAGTITRGHIMIVVANPKTADAVLTDHLGESFEQQMDQIAGRDKDGKDKDGKDKDTTSHPSFRSGSAKGTVFLVDAKSRQVLWSDYEKPSRRSLDREAERIAKQLQTFGK